MADLAFAGDEMELFATQQLHRDLAPEQSRELLLATEGWPAGVRLAIEAQRLGGASDLVGVGFLDQAVQDDLLAEILDQVPPPVRRYLQIVSHFRSFSAELCDAAIVARVAGPVTMTGAEFIDWLRRQNLFLVQLDEDGLWYRFHHLFAQLLDNWRAVHGADPQIQERDVRVRAAGVFRAHGMIEDAIEQLHLAGEDTDLAAAAADFGNQLIEEERWPELERLLASVPGDVLDSEPALLVLRAWLLGDFQSRHREMSGALDRAEALLARRSSPMPSTDGILRGQIAALRGAYEKLVAADFDGAVADAELAQELLATVPGRALTFAYVLGVVALAGAGRGEEAHGLANAVLGDERFAGAPFDPMAWALPYLGWLEGDLPLMERHARQLLAIGERFGMPDTIASANYFLGTAAYEANRLDEATLHLSKVVDHRFSTQTVNPVHSWIALALIELAQGRADDAEVSATSLMQFVLDTHSDYLQPIAEAFVAELDLRRGRTAAALRWVRNADPEAHRHRFMFYDPAGTYLEVLLSSEPDADRGRQLLEEYLDEAQRRDNRPLTIHLLGLRALDRAGRGDERGGLDSLEHGVRLSQEGGMIRTLADLGPALVPLLHRLDVTGAVLDHVAAILTAIEPDTEPAADGAETVPMVAGEPALTPREFDVLGLLAAHKTNKEIARELFIAPGTVKKNTVRLYDKLNVHGRREAVAKARTLGYLRD
jgi:LuxR family maltose regulon positive regulatory protein